MFSCLFRLGQVKKGLRSDPQGPIPPHGVERGENTCEKRKKLRNVVKVSNPKDVQKGWIS